MIISIIMPVFNGISFTQVCLRSIFTLISSPEISDADFKVIVIDDGSTDGTAGWISQHYPQVHILRGDGNLWWSGGINMGVTYAVNELNSDWLLWWNNDIKAADDFFIQLVKLTGDNDGNILMGSKVFILDKNLIWGMGGKFDPVKGSRYMYGGLQKDGDAYSKPFEVDWLPGMGTVIHRKVFEAIGLVDNINFPQYHGDSDFTYRAKKAGFKLVAFPELVIYNDNTNTGLSHRGSFRNLYKSLTSIKSNFNIKKEFIFYRKHAESPVAYFYMLKRNFRYIGGFYKWKILGYLGIQKSSNAAEDKKI
jgi:GT2 family glycosyltransferase